VGIRKIIERVGPERRGQVKHPNMVLVHGPIHASWLNQIEIYFSILQRKVLTPNDFSSLQELAQRLLAFGRHYQTNHRQTLRVAVHTKGSHRIAPQTAPPRGQSGLENT